MTWQRVVSGVLGVVGVLLMALQLSRLDDRVDALEEKLAAQPVVVTQAAPCGTEEGTDAAALERGYQALKEGERDAEYIKQRARTESRGR